jgi:hypothetical protein
MLMGSNRSRREVGEHPVLCARVSISLNVCEYLCTYLNGTVGTERISLSFGFGAMSFIVSAMGVLGNKRA